MVFLSHNSRVESQIKSRKCHIVLLHNSKNIRKDNSNLGHLGGDCQKQKSRFVFTEMSKVDWGSHAGFLFREGWREEADKTCTCSIKLSFIKGHLFVKIKIVMWFVQCQY